MNGAADTSEFISALVHAGTFWKQTVPLFAVACLLLIGGAWFVRARCQASGTRRLRAMAGNDSGSAEAMDFVLTFPIVLFVTFMFVQLLLGGHASLVVHYSAYQAARAARTAFFDVTKTDIWELRYATLAKDDPPFPPAIFHDYQGEADRAADTAARVALMNAVSSAVKYDVAPTGIGQIMYLHTGGLFGRRNFTRKKAAYAFVPENVRVEVSLVDSYRLNYWTKALAGEHVAAYPVRARVTFRYPLIMPAVKRIFGTNGVYSMSAEVTLL
jgi:hypothetical protein